MPRRAVGLRLGKNGQAEVAQFVNGEPGDVIVVLLVRVHPRQRVGWLHKRVAKDGKAGGIVLVRPEGSRVDGHWQPSLEISPVDSAVYVFAVVDRLVLVHRARAGRNGSGVGDDPMPRRLAR